MTTFVENQFVFNETRLRNQQSQQIKRSTRNVIKLNRNIKFERH